ncbi:MAG: hypothetical protein ACI4TK_03375 [Agathobacter sp.]
MIEIKNVTQIGTPREEDKIYIENLAYTRLREESYQEKRVFVLMGHTERMEGKYATFIEGVIPVRDMEFSGIVPQWNNGLWSQVFKEIKRLYEDMIIVGWAIDAKGMQPSMTPDLERIHREHFGGVHQLAFLMDTLEQDETFYIYKENKLVPKDGFFIYYRARKNKKVDATVEVIDLNKEEEGKSPRQMAQVEIETEPSMVSQRGRYRQLLSEQKKASEKESGNGGLAIAVAMLVFVIAVGAYENRDSFFKGGNSTSTEAGAEDASQKENPSEKESSSEAGVSVGGDATENTIPVEVVPGTEKSGQ